MKVTIYNPSIRTGGTNNLLANLALLLNAQKDINLNYVEYEQGATLGLIKKNTENCTLHLVKSDEKIEIEDGILIMTLLDVKNISTKMVLHDEVRLLLWSTHPDDAIKILPLFNIFYHKTKKLRLLLANLLSPIQKNRTKKFLQDGINKNGIVWMDNHNIEVNKFFYKVDNFNPNIWPVTTSEPKSKHEFNVLNNSSHIINIVILGRLCDFKIIPILDLLDDIIEIKDQVKLHFIGSGNYFEVLQNKLELLSYCYNFVGDVSKESLDEELLKYDIIIGMGTSVLEGAKLGIPSIVMNGAYNYKVPAAIKFEWIYNCPKYFLGEFVEIGSQNILKNSFKKLINEYQHNSSLIGEKCFTHWKKYHSSSSFEETALKTIAENSFYFGNVKNNIKLTLINRGVNLVKDLMKKR